MMLGELRTLFNHQPETATKADYRREVVEANVLGKPTRKARELAFGHLADLYGLAPEVAAFRAFRKLWPVKPSRYPRKRAKVTFAGVICGTTRVLRDRPARKPA